MKKIARNCFIPFLLFSSIGAITSPALASLASDTEDLATGFLTEVLISVSLLGIVVGCATWALSSNDMGKEWAKKSVIACACGLSAPTIITTLRGIFG